MCISKKLFRYEMFLGGQYQDIGVFMGLKETNLREGIQRYLLSPFDDELIVPDTNLYLCEEDNKKVLAFFTEKGEEKFKKYVDKLSLEVYEDEVFDVGRIIIDLKEEDIVYKDEYQLLVKVGYPSYMSDLTGVISYLSDDDNKITGLYKILEDENTDNIHKYILEEISDVEDFKEDIIIYPNYIGEDYHYILDVSKMIVKIV